MARRRMPAARRRLQIADAALAILATRGASELTAAAIALRIGVSDAALFRHFPSKQAIVSAAIDRFEEQLMAGFPPQHDDPIQRLRMLFEQRVALVAEKPEIVRLAFGDRLEEVAGAEQAKRVRRTVARSMRFMRNCVVEAQRRGQLPAAPPEVVVWMLTGVVRGVSEQGLPRRATARTTWNSVLQLLIR